MTKRKKDKAVSGDAWTKALRLLTRRDYSTADLRRRLRERGYPEVDIDEAIERCHELGYLDDVRYARTRARSLVAQGRAVGSRVLMDLRRHGIDSGVAERILSEVMEEFDEEQLLVALVTRRFPNFSYTAATPSERRRVVHFLQRRGFPLDHVMTNLTRKGHSFSP